MSSIFASSLNVVTTFYIMVGAYTLLFPCQKSGGAIGMRIYLQLGLVSAYLYLFWQISARAESRVRWEVMNPRAQGALGESRFSE